MLCIILDSKKTTTSKLCVSAGCIYTWFLLTSGNNVNVCLPAIRIEASKVTWELPRPLPTHLYVPVFLGLTCVMSRLPLASRITL